MAEHEDEFLAMLEEYVIPSEVFSLDAWTTADLCRLAEIIDIELQERYERALEQARL